MGYPISEEKKKSPRRGAYLHPPAPRPAVGFQELSPDACPLVAVVALATCGVSMAGRHDISSQRHRPPNPRQPSTLPGWGWQQSLKVDLLINGNFKYRLIRMTC